jgi:hypothetical protein
MNWEQRKRYEIIDALGGKCVVCGCTDKRCLQIEHVNNNGCHERRNINKHDYYKMILAKIKEGSKEYQVMCANHNQIKRHEENKNV